MVQEGMKDSIKEFIAFKNQFRLNLYNSENVQQKMLETIGVAEPITSKDPT